MRNFIHLFAKQKIMGNNALALLVLFLATREIVSRFPYTKVVLFSFCRRIRAESNPSPKCLNFGIGCANLAKGRSVLAQELLDKFSSQSEPSRPHPTLLYSFLPIYINKTKKAGQAPLFLTSVAAASDYKQRNENKPDIIVVKKSAKTVVHKCSVPPLHGIKVISKPFSVRFINII